MPTTNDPGLINQLCAKLSRTGAKESTRRKAESPRRWGRVGKRNLGVITSFSGNNYNYPFKWRLCASYFNTVLHLIFMAVLSGVIISSLQMIKMRLREFKQFAEGHASCGSMSWKSSLLILNPCSVLCSVCACTHA